MSDKPDSEIVDLLAQAQSIEIQIKEIRDQLIEPLYKQKSELYRKAAELKLAQLQAEGLPFKPGDKVRYLGEDQDIWDSIVTIKEFEFKDYDKGSLRAVITTHLFTTSVPLSDLESIEQVDVSLGEKRLQLERLQNEIADLEMNCKLLTATSK